MAEADDGSPVSFWKPVRIGDRRFRLTATTAGCVGPPEHQMFMGGVTTAAAIAALEEHTGRHTVWASAQFLGRTMDGDEIDIAVDAEPGRTLTQATATSSVAGRPISVVRAALGEGDRADELHTFAEPPQVREPLECPVKPTGTWAAPGNLFDQVERRIADDRPDDGAERMWIRLGGDRSASTAVLAIFAEFMPGAHPATRGGSGVDLTIRFVDPTPTGWVLADTQVHALARGLYHVTSHLVAEDGTLLAIASQTGRLPRTPQST